MTVTLTSLYEILPAEVGASAAGQWCDDCKAMEDAVLACGFQRVASSPQNQNNCRAGADDVVTQCFRQQESRRTIMMTCCRNGMTLDLNEQSPTDNMAQHKEFATKLQTALIQALKGYTINRVPPIKRGKKVWPYGELGDGRISESDIEEVLFDETSEYQRVSIVNTASYGRTLMLDWLENLSEDDLSYTTSLCGLERGITYRDKTVLILGGGDGGALECLRKLHPRMVTMIEIDEVVMRACRTHLRKCCGDSLDNYDGENYKIIVGDCLDYLEQYAQEGRKFDYVISDITDVPIEVRNDANGTSISEIKESWLSGSGWQFFAKVFNLSLKLIDDAGVIMTHVTATSNVRGLELFKAVLGRLDEPVDFEMFDTYVPSFCERWMFCHMRKSGGGTS